MATVFSHAIVAGSIGQSAPAEYRKDWRFWYLAVLCAILPDVDVIGFRLGVHRGGIWGHRGITHSILFALVVGLLAAARFRPKWREAGWKLALVFIAAAASHGIVDALTNGGGGIAFFAPFSDRRYFFPWRPIEVSGIGIRFLSSGRAWTVFKSELLWIWPPSIATALLIRLINSRSDRTREDA